MIDTHEIALETPDGCRITATTREGSGPALLLLAGTWGNADTRGPLIERLDPNLRLVCVSLAGQDDNWPPPSHPSISQFSTQVMALADQIGLDRCFVAGHSLGGMVSIDLLRFGPARILGAISIEGWTHWTVKANAFADDTDSTLTDTQRRFLDEVRHRLLDRWDPALRARYCSVWREWDGWDILNATPIPVLEIWGDRGRTPPSRAVMRIPDRPGIELAWIPNASHNLLVEAPDRLAALLNDFVHTNAGASCKETTMKTDMNRVRHLQVCGGEGEYAGWPANGGLWAWGNELLVGFALGTHKEQPGHSRDAATMRDTLARSLDGGDTWSIEPGPAASNIEPTHAKADTEIACPGTIDFTSAGFALTFRGATFFLSDDRGRHWQGPWRFPDVDGQRIQGRTDYLVEGPRTLLAMLTVTKQDGLEGRVGAFRTEDGGRTWKRVAWVGPEPAGFSIMPATVRLSPSRLLTVLRCRTAGTHRWLAYEVSEDNNWLESWMSDDNGASWRQVGRPVDDTGWGGNPAALVWLADGRICMAYAWRGFSLEQSSRMCVRYSANDGLDWSDEVVVRGGDGANQDVGYPRMCQRQDGRLVLLYYYNHAFRETPSWRYIAATVFEPS